MEDFGWLIFLAVIWIFSTIGEIGKQRSKQRRERERERADEDRPATGPAAGQRDLSRDVDAGARRAEEALRRWETRQKVTGGQAGEAVVVGRARTEADLPSARKRRGRARVHDPEAVRVRRRREVARRRGFETRTAAEARDDRREAYEAIAGMLAGRGEETVQATEIGGAEEIGSAELTLRRAPQAALDPARPLASPATVVDRSGPSGAAGLARLDRLPLLQRAVVLRELLGPPRALSPESDLP